MTPVFEDKNKPLSAEMRAQIIDRLTADQNSIVDGAVKAFGPDPKAMLWLSLCRAKYEALSDSELMSQILGEKE